ncbi:sce7725 family protein [Azospirillum endophyticum]
MYYPYFRGKQYELITIRETAKLMADSKFTPIVEPVKQTLNGLQKTLLSVCEAKGNAIVIVNPHYGDHSEDGDEISSLLKSQFSEKKNISAGILLKSNMSVKDVLACCEAHSDHPLALIHSGFTNAKGLVDALGSKLKSITHIFMEPFCGKLYRRHFSGCERVLIRDGFQRRRNKDHPDVEPFSDLHLTYQDESMDGFGDFLTAGDDYLESGGPAYAIAIHLTFINPVMDDEMYIYHFKSERQDTPTDPAGKFIEALREMIKTLKRDDSYIYETEAVIEFRELYERKHFPGLGHAKKLSMKHHIETLSIYFDK